MWKSRRSVSAEPPRQVERAQYEKAPWLIARLLADVEPRGGQDQQHQVDWRTGR